MFEVEQAGRLTIGALSRATGIPIETLRTWETRYGFPVPERKPSGHRLYPAEIVSRLRRIAEALACGHRAAETVTASETQLSILLRTKPRKGAAPATVAPAAEPADLSDILHAVRAFDSGSLRSLLEADWARLGTLAFLTDCLSPLLGQVGNEWQAGTLEIRHEHFLSEHVGDLLRTLRVVQETESSSPIVVFATLPGETHGLGLQMAALVAAAAGCQGLYLGTDVPVAQIAEFAHETGAAGVALSISSAADPATVERHLADLRACLPDRVELVAGGEGAPRGTSDAWIVKDFGELQEWYGHLRRDPAP
jgi:methanogenic corrinoid protein MtbC1